MAFRLAEHYPERCAYVGVQDEHTKLWSAAVFAIEKDGMLGETLYELDTYTYQTQSEAVFALNTKVESILKSVKIMSN